MESGKGFAPEIRSIGQAVFLGFFEEFLSKPVENILKGVQGLKLVLGPAL